MKTKPTIVITALALSATLLLAQGKQPFPGHWGRPPEIQTQDYVELPAGYGHGSSTLAKWIEANLTKDKAGTVAANPAATNVFFAADFETAEVGKLPDGFQHPVGEFAVVADGTNKVLELPGTPLDSYLVQFGPVQSEDVAARARILGTAKGRRFPTFGVGLGGQGGFKIQIAPGKKALELLSDQAVKAIAPFDWDSGEWTQLRLQVRKLRDGEWKIEGKAWQGGVEPKEWVFSFEEKEAPLAGRASVLGSPFAGTPIRFDDLRVERVVN